MVSIGVGNARACLVIRIGGGAVVFEGLKVEVKGQIKS